VNNNQQDFHLTDEQARIVGVHMQIAADICLRTASIYRVHGEGQAVESQVLVNLRAALDSMEKARTHAQGDDHVVSTIDHGIQFLIQQIEEHKILRDAWAVATATIESAKATRH